MLATCMPVLAYLNDYSTIVSKSKFTSIRERSIKMLSAKQVMQRLPMFLVQVETGNIYWGI